MHTFIGHKNDCTTHFIVNWVKFIRRFYVVLVSIHVIYNTHTLCQSVQEVYFFKFMTKLFPNESFVFLISYSFWIWNLWANNKIEHENFGTAKIFLFEHIITQRLDVILVWPAINIFSGFVNFTNLDDTASVLFFICDIHISNGDKNWPIFTCKRHSFKTFTVIKTSEYQRYAHQFKL